MSRGEKLATLVGIGTSLVTVLVLLIELPNSINSVNIWIALAAAVLITILLSVYLVFSNKRHDPKQQRIEERRLRTEFPAIFAFVDNIGEIRSERDFEQFVGKLNHLLEVERRARGINDVKDIETMKAIVYARLVAKKR